MLRPVQRLSETLEQHLGFAPDNPEQYRKRVKNWRTIMKYRFGLSPREYEDLLKIQHGVCAICKTPANRSNKKHGSRGFHVDHDEATKMIRGLLCSNCNTGLGLFGDSTGNLQAAIAYLGGPPAEQLQPRPSIRLEQRGSKLYETSGVLRTRRTGTRLPPTQDKTVA
jgi:hypothetical protein